MRVLPFAILALAALVLQVAVAPHLALTSARYQPQLPVILMVFISLYARSDPALLGSWTLGLLVDLASVGPLGGFAFSYALCSLGILAVRSSLFRGHPMSHFILTFASATFAEILVLVRLLLPDRVQPHALLLAPLAIGLYTALLAPYAMLLLNLFRRSLRFPERG